MAWSLRRFEQELHRFDPLLRARISKTDGNTIIVERKSNRESKCIPKPLERRGIDKWICDTQGYIQVTKLYRWQMHHDTVLEIRAQDMWQYKSAGYFADQLEAKEQIQEMIEKQRSSELLQAMGEEAYDTAMIRQGDIVSGFRSKVGGWQP